MEDENALEGLVHQSLDESPDGWRPLIEQHKSAVERFDLLGWPRPEVTVVSGSGLGVDLESGRTGRCSSTSSSPFPPSGRGAPARRRDVRASAGRHVLYYRGRLHSYQGLQRQRHGLPGSPRRPAGFEVLVMTNATGGLQLHHRAGDLVLIATR